MFRAEAAGGTEVKAIRAAVRGDEAAKRGGLNLWLVLAAALVVFTKPRKAFRALVGWGDLPRM